MGVAVINNSYFGGRCERLCSSGSAASTCAAGEAPIRVNATDAAGPCFKTTCAASGDAALLAVAKSNYAIWLAARDNATGLYLDHVNVSEWHSGQSSVEAHVGNCGLGVVVECVAHALGWSTLEEAQARVRLTLASFAGETPGVKVARNPNGWTPSFVNVTTGHDLSPTPNDTKYALMAGGLSGAGFLFGGTYFQKVDPGSPATADIVRLAKKAHAMVDYTSLPCDAAGNVSSGGGGVPMLQDVTGKHCSATQFPEADGFFNFNEETYTVWQAFHQAQTPSPAISSIWKAWEGRRFHPQFEYAGHPLLSEWSSYIVQLPFFTTYAFNSDPTYLALFKSHWLADWAYYNSSDNYAGDNGRYGLGAGPTLPWCSGTGYLADQLGKPTCRTWSPYSVAGYLPAAPEVVRLHLLALLESGESVLQVPGTGHVVLARRSLVSPTWNQGFDLTLVDFSSELLGLSTLWLPGGAAFFRNFSNHWQDGGVMAEPS